MEGSKIDMSEKDRGETSDVGIKEEQTRDNKDRRMRRESEE